MHVIYIDIQILLQVSQRPHMLAFTNTWFQTANQPHQSTERHSVHLRLLRIKFAILTQTYNHQCPHSTSLANSL